jgi:hypothetical protein
MWVLAPGFAQAGPTAQPPMNLPTPESTRKSTQILFLCDLKPHKQIQNPTITPYGRKISVWEERKRKIAINSGHLILWQLFSFTKGVKTKLPNFTKRVNTKLPYLTKVILLRG